MRIAHATAPARGELRSGDAAVIREEPGATMIVLIDVLGHGPEAARVADLAVGHLARTPIRRARDAMHELQTVLHGSRGAAASVCVIRGARLDGCGVGNVEIRVQGAAIPILLTPGIIGRRIDRVREFEGTLADGDRLVLFSDGISSRVALAELRGLAPDAACLAIMQRHRRDHDDATVVIADLDLSRKDAS